MIMLSNLKRFVITDDKGKRAKFADLAVALLDSDYPIVNYLFYQIDKRIMRLPWDAVECVNLKNKQIKVFDLKQGEEAPLESSKDYVLLKCEILDALLLDLQNRRAIRANDLQLEKKGSQLQLRAADTGLSPIFRRISFGFYNYVIRKGLHDWKYVEYLRGNPKAVKNGAGYHLRITRMSPGEIGELTNFIPYLHAAELLTLLPDPQAAKTLEVMPVERQLQVLEEVEEEQALRLLALMAPDTAADLIGLLQSETMRRFLELLPRPQSERIIELLRYPADTVGGIMTNDVAYLAANLTVAEARIELRNHFADTDFVYLIFIVGDNVVKNLLGVISLRNLFTADDEQKLEEIMDPYVATLSSTESSTDAAYRVVGSQLAAMPVIGLNNKLLGAVTIDSAISAITPSNNAENLRIFS